MTQKIFQPELLYEIVKYIPITEIKKVCISLCPSISVKTLNSIVYNRIDISYLFDGIFDNVPEFLDMMEKCKIGLSGYYGKQYITPSASKSVYSWEFYCHNHPLSILRFMRYMTYVGVRWDSKHNWNMVWNADMVYEISGQKQLNSGKIVPIKLYWTSSCSTNISSVALFNHRCIIWKDMVIVDPKNKLLDDGNSTFEDQELNGKYSIIDLKYQSGIYYSEISLKWFPRYIYIYSNQMDAYEIKLYETIREPSMLGVINWDIVLLKYKPTYLSKVVWDNIIRNAITIWT